MKKNALFALMAVVPLMVLSCAKEMAVEAPETPQVQADPWTPVDFVEAPALAGDHSVSAGFSSDKTKTHLEMNGAGTYAGLLWNSGDTFRMVGMNSDGYYQTATYSTSSSGARADFSTGSSIAAAYTVSGLHSVSPASAFMGVTFIGSEKHFKVQIPSSQTAVAGGVDPLAILSYAQSTTQDEDLHFKNAVSLIKFRLSGDIVSQVKSISFKGVSNIAGQFYLSLASSEPAFAAGSYGGLVSSREVVLSGDFVAGQDYYMAVAPCIEEGFKMTFSNSDGTKVLKKTSEKTITFNRSTITDFGTINIGNSFPDPEPAPTPYIAATAGASKAVTLCVIPDGFQESELDEYELQAKSGIDALFNTEPYKTYKNYFNVWILKKASNESGANITDGSGNITTARDCYFQSKWGESSYSDMSANESRIDSFIEDNCPDIMDGSHTLQEVPVLLIINDTRYGGIAHTSSNGKTYCMVPTTSGSLAWGYYGVEAASVTAAPNDTREVSSAERSEMVVSTGTWRNTLVHEFGGHSFGRLKDEYWYNSYKSAATSMSTHTWPVPFGLNISVSYVAEETPWAALLEPTNVAKMTATGKSQYTERIGVFQGGDVSMFNRWRSERISCMIDNRCYFSTWQRWLIVNRIMTLAGEATLGIDEFLTNDKPEDPLRDGGSSTMLPEGLVNSIPPKPVPLLPPPVFHEDW